jgi:hypothetical protein
MQGIWLHLERRSETAETGGKRPKMEQWNRDAKED